MYEHTLRADDKGGNLSVLIYTNTHFVNFELLHTLYTFGMRNTQ